MSETFSVVAVLLALACFFVIVWGDIRRRMKRNKDKPANKD